MENQTDAAALLKPTEENIYFGGTVTGLLTAETVKALEISFAMLGIITNTKVMLQNFINKSEAAHLMKI